MRIPFRTGLLPAVLAGVLVGTSAWADDELPETDAADVEAVESVAEVPSGKIAGFFSDFLGGEEQSRAKVEGLRGGSISYQPPEDTGDGAEGDAVEDVADGDTDVDEVEGETGEATAGMGYGNVFITLALAEQLATSSAAEAAGETGVTPEESLNEVLYLRQVEGMGWGRIAKELGVNLGEVISGIRSNRPDKVENAKAERMARADKGVRPEKARKVERADRVEKVARLERPERPERPVKPQRPEKVERPEKPARPERPSR